MAADCDLHRILAVRIRRGKETEGFGRGLARAQASCDGWIVGVTPTVDGTHSHVAYTAVVLDEDSHRRLLEAVEDLIPPGYERVAHHMTMNLGPFDADLNPPELLGREVKLQATTWGSDERVMAVGVEAPVRSMNERPHVTVAVNEAGGGHAKDSNELVEWRPLREAVELTGVVREVAFGEYQQRTDDERR